MKTKLLVISLIFLTIIVSIIVFYYFVFIKNTNNGFVNPPITEQDFTLTTSYIGNNLWEYTITGTLPNPCYTISIEPIVMESYPEQVVINLHIQESREGICVQVIQEVEESGTFKASEIAKISMDIK